MDTLKHSARTHYGLALIIALAATSCQPTDTAAQDFAAEPHAPAATPAPTPAPTPNSATTLGRASANAPLGPGGGLSVALGDATVRIKRCAAVEVSPTVARCEGDTHVDVSLAGKEQSLLFTSVYIDSEATIYRGPLDVGYEQNGHSFIFTDVNGDRREDLIVWTGKEGAYGGPSYDVLLQDPADGQFHVTPLLSELTVGANGLFLIDKGRLHSTSTDGCCLRIIDTYVVTRDEPRLLERTIEERDERTGRVSTRTERAIDGKLEQRRENAGAP